MKKKLLILQGANMNWLGRRDPAIYGSVSASELDDLLARRAGTLGLSLEIFYTNLEGEAINRVYAAAEAGLDALVFNPAGFLHTGYALRDCLAAMTFPCIEVHMSNIEKRGFHSITASAATGMVCGFGPRSYILGIDAALGAIEERGIASQSARSTA